MAGPQYHSGKKFRCWGRAALMLSLTKAADGTAVANPTTQVPSNWKRSRLLRDDFPVFPNVDGCSIHAGRLPGVLGRQTQCTPDPRGKTFRLFSSRRSFHGCLSNSSGAETAPSVARHGCATRRCDNADELRSGSSSPVASSGFMISILSKMD